MFRKFLYPISLLYGFGSTFRRILYQYSIVEKKYLPKKVISVGNLSVGGSGKTPITIEIAKYFQSKSFKPVILSRGYKRKSKEDVIICSQNNNWKDCGDEPYLMTLKGLNVVVGKDRYKSGIFYLEKDTADIFILDDGYQHFQLYRDFNILVIDATKPFWEDFLLPVGNLREPKFFYKYADCFVINRFNLLDNKEDFIEKVRKYKKPFFITKHQFEGLFDNSWNFYDMKILENKTVVVFAGLGNNKQFFQTVYDLAKKYKFFIEKSLSFPDHYNYKDFNPDKDKLYLTTEKDLVKLRNHNNIYGLSYKTFLPKEFYNFMEEKLWKTKIR
jgi:tetraacyldisaccharide 4'-kinase